MELNKIFHYLISFCFIIHLDNFYFYQQYLNYKMNIHNQRNSNLDEEQEKTDDREELEEEEELIREENIQPGVNQEETNQTNSAIGHETQEQLQIPEQNQTEIEAQQEEIQRKSSLPAKLEYENVKVSFPYSTDTGINSYMIYKVKYTWGGKDFIVNRRFSDFTSLRESLKKFLPCHYIYPVHKKRTIVI